MNKIINKINTNEVAFVRGSIWKDSMKNLYILSCVGYGSYSAIGLRDGNRWKDIPKTTMEEAVNGLTFVTASAAITITNDNS